MVTTTKGHRCSRRSIRGASGTESSTTTPRSVIMCSWAGSMRPGGRSAAWTDVAAVECWLRYDLQPGDTALALAVCWSGGTIVSSGNGVIRASRPPGCSRPSTFLAATNVDSVVVAFASTDPFTEGIAQQGSWVEVDDVHLTHPNVPTRMPCPMRGSRIGAT